MSPDMLSARYSGVGGGGAGPVSADILAVFCGRSFKETIDVTPRETAV